MTDEAKTDEMAKEQADLAAADAIGEVDVAGEVAPDLVVRTPEPLRIQQLNLEVVNGVELKIVHSSVSFMEMNFIGRKLVEFSQAQMK